MSNSRGQRQVDFLKQGRRRGGHDREGELLDRARARSHQPDILVDARQHGALTLQDLPWTPELEEYLLYERPTQMDNRADERERFANLRGNNLKTIEAQFGPDFAQAVLVEILGERPEYALGQLLAKVSVYPPSRGSASYHECRMLLEHALVGLQNTAVLKLGYPNGRETIQLVGEALGIVLDDKLHISLRTQLFPG